MGKPRPKVSKSTTRGQSFAVKAIQRAQLQQEMSPEEQQLRLSLYIPMDMSDAEIIEDVSRLVDGLDWHRMANVLKNSGISFLDPELQTSPLLRVQLRSMGAQVLFCRLGEKDKALSILGHKELTYRFYRMLAYYSRVINGHLPMVSESTDAATLETNEESNNAADAAVGKSRLARTEIDGAESVFEEEEDCIDGCGNPECENYMVDMHQDIYVPCYSFLIETGRHPPSYYYDEVCNDPQAEAVFNSKKRLEGNKRVSNFYVQDLLCYGESGHYLPLFGAIKHCMLGNSKPRFVRDLDKSLDSDFEWEREQLRRKKHSSLGLPDDLTVMFNRALDLDKARTVPTTNRNEPFLPKNGVMPTRFGDYILTITDLDFASPIMRDGYVRLNGHKVRATLIPTGTDNTPSYVSYIRRLGEKLDKSFAPKKAFRRSPQGQLAPVPPLPKSTEEDKDKDKNSASSPAQIQDTLVALRGMMLLELQSGSLKGKMASLEKMIEEGKQSLERKAAATAS